MQDKTVYGPMVPWYSVSEEVYHQCSNCSAGRNIPAKDFRRGTGKRPRCDVCEDLINKGKC